MAVSQARLFRIYTRNLKIETHVRPNARFCPIVEILGRVTNQNYGVYICRKPKEKPKQRARAKRRSVAPQEHLFFSLRYSERLFESNYLERREKAAERSKYVEAIDPLDQSLRQSNHADREETR